MRFPNIFGLRWLPASALVLALAACGAMPQGADSVDTLVGKVEAKVAAFEQRAAPVIARACDAFHRAEASALVQTALDVGVMAANAATGVPVAGIAVSAVKGFGDRFCAEGPPAGDTTSAMDQAAWLVDIGRQMLAAAR